MTGRQSQHHQSTCIRAEQCSSRGKAACHGVSAEAAGLQPYACQEAHTSVSGLHFGSLPPLPLSCNSYEQCAHPPLLHSRVRNGKEANFPSSVPGHMKTKENQRMRKIKDMGQLRQMKGQRVGKGRLGNKEVISRCQTTANPVTRLYLDEAPGKTS